MLNKAYNQKLCLFTILILLLWVTVSGADSTAEITDIVCTGQNSYVNHMASAIIPAGKHIPAQEYLADLQAGTEESISTARVRSIRPLTRTVRQIAARLLYLALFAVSFAVFGRLSYREILSYNPRGIIITNYIHQTDGRKS